MRSSKETLLCVAEPSPEKLTTVSDAAASNLKDTDTIKRCGTPIFHKQDILLQKMSGY